MHAGGRGRGRGGEEKTHNKTCVAERTAGLEWKEPALAERCRDSGERVGPAGRGAGAQQVPGTGGRLGQGVQAQHGQRILTSCLVLTVRQLPGAGPSHLAPQLEPCTEGTPGSSPSGVQPQRNLDLAGAFPPLWPEAGPSPWATPAAHIWKEFKGGWEGGSGRTLAGDRECGGQVELGRGVDAST